MCQNRDISTLSERTEALGRSEVKAILRHNDKICEAEKRKESLGEGFRMKVRLNTKKNVCKRNKSGSIGKENLFLAVGSG